MHEIIITPALESNQSRKCGQRFTARYKGVLLCTSETPFLDGARELLRRNWARPDDIITMRHEGSQTWAMRATIGMASDRAIKQPSAGKAPTLAKFEPFARPDTKSAA